MYVSVRFPLKRDTLFHLSHFISHAFHDPIFFSARTETFERSKELNFRLTGSDLTIVSGGQSDYSVMGTNSDCSAVADSRFQSADRSVTCRGFNVLKNEWDLKRSVCVRLLIQFDGPNEAQQ